MVAGIAKADHGIYAKNAVVLLARVIQHKYGL